LASAVQYNEPCTFSLGTCDWNIGRRWHIANLDDEDKGFEIILLFSFSILILVLTADAESKEDKRIGFTDAIMSSWLHLSPLCSFDIRLTFQYNIENEDDLIEIYLIEKNRTRMSSLGQWKGLKTNQSIWQQGNVTFKASEEFRVGNKLEQKSKLKFFFRLISKFDIYQIRKMVRQFGLLLMIF
jgi:hypothetical protein